MAVLSSSPSVTGSDRTAPTAVLAIAAAAGLCLSAALSPGDATSGPVVCPFRLVTGLPCPGCGMTRAWVFMTHGRVADAVSANPFVLVTMPAAITLVLLVCAALVRRRPLPDLARALRSPVAKVVVAAWLAFALVRLVAVLSGHATV
jgi:Protein of unknown function (DUF2752)